MQRPQRLLRGLLVAGFVTIATAVAAPIAGAHEADISVTFDSGRTDPGPYAYEPQVVRVDVGGTLTWENHDDLTDQSDNNAVDHPTTCLDGPSKGECPWSSEPLPPGGTFSVTFPQPGTFEYFCSIHPYMEGTIIVGDGVPPADEPEPEPSATTPEPRPTPSPTVVAEEPEPSAAPSDQPQEDPSSAEEPAESDGPTSDEGSPEDDTGLGSGDPPDAATPAGQADDGSGDEPGQDDTALDAGEDAPDDDGTSGGPLRVAATLAVGATGIAVGRAWRRKR